jgi:putative transposase
MCLYVLGQSQHVWYDVIMPRNARKFKIQVGGFYHIIKRGVNKEKIFRNGQDYSRFIFGLELFNSQSYINLWQILSRSGDSLSTVGQRLQRVRERKEKPIVEIHAFCLMPNHIHLILREIKVGGISEFMRKFGGFSTYFNKRYERSGPLFEGRYKAVPIQSDEQLANTFRYVHTNPVELWEPMWKEFCVQNPKEAIKRLEDYKPSSYRNYIGKENVASLVTTEFFSEFFGDQEACRGAVEDWVAFKASNTKMDRKELE